MEEGGGGSPIADDLGYVPISSVPCIIPRRLRGVEVSELFGRR